MGFNVVTALQSLDRQTGLVKIQSEQRKFNRSVVRPKIKRPSGQSSNGHPAKDQTAIRSKFKRPSGQSSNGRPVKVQTAGRPVVRINFVYCKSTVQPQTHVSTIIYIFIYL